MRKIKTENQILIMLAFFSMSIGLWGNFRQLWLQDNGFNVVGISNILSLGTLVSVLGIMFIASCVSLRKIKGMITIAIFVKFFNMILLYYHNQTGLSNYISLFTIIDVLTEYIVITSIYPFITTIVKGNTIYSKRKLTQYLFEDVGILIGGILIGKTFLGMRVSYNLCLLLSNIFLGVALVLILNIKTIKPNENDPYKVLTFKNVVLKNKILTLYLVYAFFSGMAYVTALGLKILLFKNFFDFTDGGATTYVLIVELIGDVFGIIALKYLTPKNDYITMTIKFGIRFLGYVVAFLSNNLWITFVAISWSLFIGAAYENVCDGPYINAVANEYQLKFTNLKYIIKYFGESIGMFFCGLMYARGLRYMFGLSAFFMIFQLTFCYMLIYMRHKQKINIPPNDNNDGIKLEYKKRKYAYATAENNKDNNYRKI